MPEEKNQKKVGRGNGTDANSQFAIAKWLDNKCVQIISNYCDSETTTLVVKEWYRKWQTYIEIDCTTDVQEYNKIRGIDLADMLISHYRTTIKIKRWYLKIWFHIVDIVKVNEWLMYRYHCDQHNVPKKSQLSLLKFTVSIALGLANAQTDQITRPVGRPSKSSIEGEIRKRKNPSTTSVPNVRYDKIAHWSEFREARNKKQMQAL